MRILSIRPEAGESALARFDVEVGPHLRLYNLLLRKAPDGRLRTFAPNAMGKHVATFHPDLANEITRAATAAITWSVTANAITSN